jgi:hypothetical protein
VTNCGGCGITCAFANASASCASGACVMGACAAGYADCDGSATNGCETNTRADAGNCGGCGTTCAAGQVCSNGACATTCGGGLSNCSGSCVDENNDPTHCGSCTHVCGAAAHQIPVCVSRTCYAFCSPGFGDCDGVAGNGCEATLASDGANCGRCGHACGAGTTCAAGACVPVGLVHCWGGEGDGTDAIGGNDAIVHADVSFVAGRSGQAFHCSGMSGASADVDASTRPMVAPLGPWTIELWIRRSASDADAWILDRRYAGFSGTGTPMVDLHTDDTGNAAWILRFDDGASSGWFPTFSLPAGTWVHAALTRSGDTYAAYADGMLLGTWSDPTSAHELTLDPPRWCGGVEMAGSAMTGEIDSLRVWSRALGASEVANVSVGDGSCTAAP